MTTLDIAQAAVDAASRAELDAWLDSLPAFQPPRPVGEIRRVVLTRMQHNVLESLCEGKETSEIVTDWGISENTVKTHIKRMLAALGARDRAQAVAWVLTRAVDVRIKPYSRRFDPLAADPAALPAVHATQGTAGPYPPPS